jgi:hypothetical protein
LAPSLSIGAVLLQQAAAAAAFQYKNVEILESQCNLAVISLHQDWITRTGSV